MRAKLAINGLVLFSNVRFESIVRGGSRAAAKSKMDRFVIIVNGFQPLAIITKRSILDVAAVLDPHLLPDTHMYFLNE